MSNYFIMLYFYWLIISGVEHHWCDLTMLILFRSYGSTQII